jgi:hypothetical protein
MAPDLELQRHVSCTSEHASDLHDNMPFAHLLTNADSEACSENDDVSIF